LSRALGDRRVLDGKTLLEQKLNHHNIYSEMVSAMNDKNQFNGYTSYRTNPMRNVSLLVKESPYQIQLAGYGNETADQDPQQRSNPGVF